MKKYENYKDSGLEWLGMVPEHWKSMKIKYLFSFGRGLNITKSDLVEDGIPVISYGQIHSKANTGVAVKEELLRFVPTDIASAHPENKVHIGDFIFADTSEDKEGCGNCAYIDREGIYAGYHSLVLDGKGRDNKYFAYLFKSEPWRIQIRSKASGVKVFSITQSIMGESSIILPPLTEQRTIASYLDQKVGQIDALISEKEKMVEDLKAYRSSLITETVTKGLDKEVEMKDSGVEWIGKMPSKWTVTKLKYICKINGRIGFRGYTTDDLVSEGNGAFTIGGKHISKNLLDLSSPEYISWEKYYESPEIMVKKGDIVSAQRGTLGRTAYIDKEIGPATINPSLVLINDIIEDAKFLYWFMVSNSFLSIIEFVNTATAVPMISQTQFGNTLIPLPPISEQHIIVEYLEKEISKIDTSISEIEHQLSDLKSYKSSLITEAVTGKIDLRDWQTKKS